MNKQLTVLFVTRLTLFALMFASGQHDHRKSTDMPMNPSEKTGHTPALKPAEGAGVKIISPKEGQVFKGDEIPLQFKLTKGKKAEHVHAYVDGQLMGMFKSERGTLTGVKPGQHVLELRVVAEDHQTELDATAKVLFVVK